MSEQEITPAELREFFAYNSDRQKRAAEFVGVSPRTLDGWRSGKPIPPAKADRLRLFMRGMDELTLNVSQERRARIARIAEEKGYPSPEAFILDVLTRFFILTIAAAMSHQLLSDDDTDLRPVRSGRREEGLAGLCIEC